MENHQQPQHNTPTHTLAPASAPVGYGVKKAEAAKHGEKAAQRSQSSSGESLFAADALFTSLFLFFK